MSTEPAFPDRSRRQVCWAARDRFFACIDRAYSPDAPTADPDNKCALPMAEFVSACPPSWAKHFASKREAYIRERKLGLRPVASPNFG
ncbi:hypothetical protein BC828DRAFT_407125 [Blastocladiella britannica]|nr:hypothetical protein BC828DRAFT_407125 [Blastocladiella britannica]